MPNTYPCTGCGKSWAAGRGCDCGTGCEELKEYERGAGMVILYLHVGNIVFSKRGGTLTIFDNDELIKATFSLEQVQKLKKFLEDHF